MRTTDERLAAAKRRAEEIKRQERSRRSRIAAVSGAAACLAVILGLALTMPSVTARFSGADYYGGMTASLFTGESLGYLLVGLLAFALGVCVTVLCVRLLGSRPQRKGNKIIGPSASEMGADHFLSKIFQLVPWINWRDFQRLRPVKRR